MDILIRKKSVEQVNLYFTNFSLCYFNFYFSTGYFCLFYKRIKDFFSNEFSKGIGFNRLNVKWT